MTRYSTSSKRDMILKQFLCVKSLENAMKCLLKQPSMKTNGHRNNDQNIWADSVDPAV